MFKILEVTEAKVEEANVAEANVAEAKSTESKSAEADFSFEGLSLEELKKLRDEEIRKLSKIRHQISSRMMASRFAPKEESNGGSK